VADISPGPLTWIPQWRNGSISARYGRFRPAGLAGQRGNAPCVMEIVFWLTAGTIDTAWPGVSPAIAEYVQAAQDAMDDEARQKQLVLVPGLIGCAGKGDPPEIESARRLLLAQRSLSQLVPLVLEAVG
jgi:hypothetical protein